ncbi:hypothetical protein ABLO27_00365 [Roseibium sp. SCPC15]|uniref:hypothetical protein n=1 Tax=Roseibium sp. SCP15 TaxID=3141376 RepID=UPI00333BC9D6
MSDLVALLFGALIIGFFSYERFNRATYEGRKQLERLVDLLTPDKLRARRVVLHAYLFYALTLLLIYFFLCAYAEVLPYLGGPELASGTIGASQLPSASSGDTSEFTTGFIPHGNWESVFWAQQPSNSLTPSPERSYFNIGIDPSISLTMALIIVGLAPTFPILQRFEDWMRVAAHRLAGIPTRVIGAGEDLRRNAMQIANSSGNNGVPKNSLLIPRGDWERMHNYTSAAEGQLADPQDFQEDLTLIFAASSWILDRKVKLANAGQRERFDKLEDELRRRKNVLVLELDERSGYLPGDPRTEGERAAQRQAPEQQETDPARDETSKDEAGNSNEKKRASWERLAAQADHLADDLCILLALYVEHEIIVAETTALPPRGSAPSSVRQQILARQKLVEFLGELLSEHAAPIHLRSFAMLTVLWSFGVVLIVTLAWSFFPGPFETELQRGAPGNPYVRALIYLFTAFNSICVPIMVALALRDGGRQSHRWRNMWRSHWTKKLPQAALVVFVSWIVSTLFIIGLTLWQSAIDLGGWSETHNKVWETLRYSFEYNAPTPLRGAILALMLVTLLDARIARAGSLNFQNSIVSSLIWATCAAVIMAICGAFTRFLTSWASALSRSPSNPSLDSIDHGLIAYAAIYSSILGFLVVFCVAEALLNQRRPRAKREKQTAPPKTLSLSQTGPSDP